MSIKETRACFQCQKPGHIKRNCPDTNRNPPQRGGGARGRGGRGGRGGGSGQSIECHQCYRAGHMAKECQASNVEANQARAARAARTANKTSVNELAAAETASTVGAAAASQEPAIALNPYAPAWTSNTLNCMSEQAGIYTLSDVGRDDLPDRLWLS